MLKKYLIYCILILIFLLTISSYANYLNRQDYDVSKSGQVTWKDAEKALDKRLNWWNKMLSSYSLQTRVTEEQYLVYICMTHNIDYNIYYDYALKFKVNYLNNAPELSDFMVLSEEDYNKLLNSYKKSSENNNLIVDSNVIADSGFLPENNGYIFSNFSVEDTEEGLCMGISTTLVNLYLYQTKNKTLYTSFKNTKANLEHYANKETVNYYTNKHVLLKESILVDLLGYEFIYNKLPIYNYYPESDFLQNEIPFILRNNNSNKLNKKGLIFNNIKESRDKELVKYILWEQVWGVFNKNYYEYMLSFDDINLSDYQFDNAIVIDYIIDELKNGYPVIVSVDGFSGSHALVGYKIEKDCVNSQLYYLYVYDSNFPNNVDFSSNIINNKLILYKDISEESDEVILYCLYSPYSKIDNNKEQYRYVNNIVFLDKDGNILSGIKNLSTNEYERLIYKPLPK